MNPSYTYALHGQYLKSGSYDCNPVFESDYCLQAQVMQEIALTYDEFKQAEKVKKYRAILSENPRHKFPQEITNEINALYSSAAKLANELSRFSTKYPKLPNQSHTDWMRYLRYKILYGDLISDQEILKRENAMIATFYREKEKEAKESKEKAYREKVKEEALRRIQEERNQNESAQFENDVLKLMNEIKTNKGSYN